jgi:hypothetical protein
LQADQLFRERSYPIGIAASPPKVHPHVAAIGPTQVRKRSREREDASLHRRVIFVVGNEQADQPYALALLCSRC